MRRTLVLLSLSLGLLFYTTGAAAQPRRLTILSYDNPPFITVQSGQVPQGMVLDVVRELFRRVNTPIDVRVYPLARALAMMHAGDADAMFTMKKTAERELSFRFQDEALLVQDYMIFVNRDSTLAFTGDLTALANVSIGMLDKTSYGPVFDAAAKRGAFKRLEVAQHHESNFSKLMAHRMDAVICGRRVGLAILERLHATDRVKIIGPPLNTAPSYLMFNRKTVPAALIARLDKELIAMHKDGSLRKIEMTWGVPHDSSLAGATK